MNENLLQYLWNFKIFETFDFKDIKRNGIEMIDFGKWNHNTGADFLMAKVKINGIILVGNIELHVKSSDWDLHKHTGNPDFENIILHVVYEHDKSVDFLEQKNIPTLELKHYISPSTLDFYQKIETKEKFIACEELLTPEHIPFQFSEGKLLQKLDEKTTLIETDLKEFKNDYEAILFHHLAYAFGLKINAPIFKSLAQNIDFKTIQKISQNITVLESLFFGYAGWLNNPKDDKMETWQKEFNFITKKFRLNDVRFRPQFFRLRPPNFPTIRLSQLAMLYHQEKHLFSKIIKAKKIEEITVIFEPIHASDYWENHFNFGKISEQKSIKKLSKPFIDLLLLNAILPIKYAYHRHQKEETNEEILRFYENIKPEKNTILKNWKTLKVSLDNALESQAFLYHYKKFCQTKKCLNCDIGFQILKTQI